MGNKSKSKPSSEDNETANAIANPNANASDSPDIFKLLFGREAAEEPGLGLGLDKSYSNPRNANSNNLQIDSKKKKKKRENHDDLDLNVSEIAENSPKKKKGGEEKVQKLKRKEVLPESDVVEYSGEVADSKKKKKKKDSSNTDDGGVMEVAEKAVEDMKEKSKKKKRKRDEIEEAYEAKTYGVVANVEVKKEVKVGEKRKSIEDTAAMTVSKDDFDDESKLLRTIFVGNLPLKFKKKALLKEFTKFGEVESVRIRSVPLVDSKTPRKGAILKGKINEAIDSVNAYIVFKDEKSAQASLSHNMATVGGNHIRVDKACPPRKKLKGDSSSAYDNQKTVFVGNLPFDVKDEEIYKLFCGLSQIESSVEAVRVIRDPTSSIGKGIAYVLFKTKEAANLVVRRRHLKIRDRDLRLYHAKPDTTPSKKRDLPSTDKSSSSSGKRFAVSPSSGSKSLSYQGLKATTKSVPKKEFKSKDGFRPRSQPHNHNNNSRPSAPSDVKERKNKRPAVAARKAKALRVAANTGGKGNGMKRKAENRTPDQRNKKPRFK